MKRFTIAAFWILLVSATANMVFKVVEDTPLTGAFERAPRPQWALGSFMRGEFQKSFEDWYNTNYGLRGYVVKLDSTLSYYAFRDVPSGARARRGRGGVLFMDEDLAYFNKREVPTRVQMHAQVRQTRELLDVLRARSGPRMVVVISPSKTSFFAESVSSDLRLPTAGSDKGVHDTLVELLRKEGIPFVDSRTLLADWPRERVFSPYGRHWTWPAACAVLAEVARLANLPGASSVNCDVVGTVADGGGGTDFDLWNLLNVWRLTPFEYASPVMRPIPPPAGPRPKVLWVGSSFVFTMTDSVDRNHLFEDDIYYYNNAHRLRSGVDGPLKPESAAWIQNALAKDLIVIEVLETYLPDVGCGFVQQLTQALASSSGGAAALSAPAPRR